MWELYFSYDKFQLLLVGYFDPSAAYHLGNHVITPSDVVCDLGVNIHSSLKPSFNISTIVRKANIRSKLIPKCFLSYNQDKFTRAFKVYVRPLLECNCVIWNPWLLQDINLIESIQRNFTRCVCLICHLPLVSYEERLSMFKLERLELRRFQIDLTNVFKNVQHFTACNIYNVLNFCHASHNSRGHSFKLVPCRTNKSCLKYFYQSHH